MGLFNKFSPRFEEVEEQKRLKFQQDVKWCAAKLQQVQVAFTNLLGSAQKAEQELRHSFRLASKNYRCFLKRRNRFYLKQWKKKAR